MTAPTDRPVILQRLQGVQRSGAGWLAYCPAHDDRHKRSLSVSVGDDGRTLLYCHARRCTAEQITAAVKMTLADLAPPGTNSHRARREVATYDYTDEHGELVYQVVRFDPKDFRCRRPDGRGGWLWNLDGVRVVPYRLHKLPEARRVYVAEGERDCDRLAALGLTATTNHGGAGKWREEHTRALVAAAVPEVVVLRDNDTPGAAHQEAVARSCAAAGLAVKVVALPGLPPLRDKHGEDVSDWLAAGHTVAEVEALAGSAPEFVADASPSADSGAELAPTVDAAGDDYRIAWADALELVAVAPRESGEGIHAEVTVSLRGKVLSWGRLNLASTSMREGLVKKLRETAPELPWRERLEGACRTIAERVRAGSPLIVLRPAPRPMADRDLIEDVFPLGQTSMIYGDGDTGKGWLLLTIAISVITGHPFPHIRPMRSGLRVAYLDWETMEADVAARADAICRGIGLALPTGMLLYREMSRALADDAGRLRAELARAHVDVVMVDSMIPANGSEPDGADSTIRTLNALRSFTGTSRLIISHVNRMDADKASGTARPWGSVFNRNLVRAAWEIRRSDQDSDDLVLGAYLTKRNDGKRGVPPWALRYSWTSDGAVAIASANLAESPDLLARASVGRRITVALGTGALTVAELAEHLGVPETTVGRIVRRLRDKGRVVQVGDERPHRWGLAAQ